MEKLFIKKEEKIIDAMKKLDINGRRILLVIENNKLYGVITDGDIRRWILKNGSLEASVEKIANTKPIVLNYREKRKALKTMLKNNIGAIPLVYDDGSVKSVLFWNDLNNNEFYARNKIDIPVVIMAGGEGSRLHPYTKILPKPLIPIGDTPIIERIVNKFNEFGCTEFFISVNYKKNMIKSYFGDVMKHLSITYIEEDIPLGTAGSLGMLKNKIDTAFFVSNCDILIDADYADILKSHKNNKNKITMVTSVKGFEVPYGVIQLDEKGNVEKIVEKPKSTYLVNTGFYVFEPEVLSYIPENKFLDLPVLYENLLKKGEKVGIYPISEGSWMDMGQVDNLKDMLRRLNIEE